MKTTMKLFATLFFFLLIHVSMTAAQNHASNQTSKALYSPFQIHIDPMESLLLINFENEPDSLYLGFEPQVFNDSINGQGMLVIAWRVDGFVDVYHQPTLQPDSSKYDIAGKGLAHLIQVPLEGAYFRVEEQGVQAWFRFTDIAGREVECRISESNTRKRKPFGLLAPMGHAAENPSAMPLILLHDFYFVRQKDSEVSIQIGSEFHTPDIMPMRMDRQKMTFIRYSPDPLIATLNPAHCGTLDPIQVSGNNAALHNNRYDLIEKDGKHSFSRITASDGNHDLNMQFYPPFPELTSINDGDSYKGRFEIEGHRSTGRVRGIYTIERTGDNIHISVIPSGGWKPRPDKFSLRFLYTVARMFKNWPKTYEWKADISVTENGQFTMHSAWHRNPEK